MHSDIYQISPINQHFNNIKLRQEVYYLRDNGKIEVDFLVIKDNFPWFLGGSKDRQVFQVIIDASYVNIKLF